MILSTKVNEPFVPPSLAFVRNDSFVSDATCSNNPGPGRNLGRLFNSLGARLEDFLNKRATKRRRGPDALAYDIRDVRRYRRAFALGLVYDRTLPLPSEEEIREARFYRGLRNEMFDDSPTREDIQTLKRLCRRLLKCCSSPVLSVQIQALEEVTSLAVEDHYVREVLINVLHDSHLTPKYEERELYVSSSKALTSLKHEEIYEFWRKFTEGYVNSGRYIESNDFEISRFRSRFFMYLRDPDVSFLVARLLKTELDRTFYAGAYKHVWKCYVEVAYTKPEVIEYETLHTLFDGGDLFYDTQCVVCDNADHIMELARHFPIFSDSKTVGALQFRQRSIANAEADIELLDSRSHQIIQFLNKLCDSKDLRDQLQHLRSLNVKAREYLQETVLGNDVLIAYAHVSQLNQSTGSAKMRGVDSYFSAACVLLHYYICGNTDEKALAEAFLLRSLESSRYFKYSLDKAIRSWPRDSGRITVIPTPSTSQTQQTLTLRRTSRHRIKRKQFLHNAELDVRDDGDMNQDDTLYASVAEYTWLRVRGQERPFDSTGHFPVLAGYDASGAELYVARVLVGNSSLRWPRWSETMVADGVSSVSVVGSDGCRRKSYRFDVMVLRHDPCDLRARAIPQGARFQTGPVYWLREEEHRLKGYSTPTKDDGDSQSEFSDSDSDLDESAVEVESDDSRSTFFESPLFRGMELERESVMTMNSEVMFGASTTTIGDDEETTFKGNI